MQIWTRIRTCAPTMNVQAYIWCVCVCVPMNLNITSEYTYIGTNCFINSVNYCHPIMLNIFIHTIQNGSYGSSFKQSKKSKFQYLLQTLHLTLCVTIPLFATHKIVVYTGSMELVIYLFDFLIVGSSKFKNSKFKIQIQIHNFYLSSTIQ